MGRRKKYKQRKDGRCETMRTYKDFHGFSGVKHFYGRSDDEIDRKIEDFERSLMEEPVKSSRLFDDVADEWWNKKMPMLSPNSISSFSSKIKEVEYRFGDRHIDEITTSDVLSWLQFVAAQNISQRGISDRRSVLKQIFDYALAQKEIESNPCNGVPRVQGKPAKKRHAAPDEDIEIIESVKTESLISRLYYFLEYTGCRVGEAAVLQQKHIDIEHHKATICQNLAFNGQDPVVKNSTKTEAGQREIDLYDNVIDILPQYDDPDTFIFFPEGLPRKSPYETALKNFRKQHGISATPHQLRHTYASIMHSAEIDVKDTQSRLGHANIAMTQDVYTEIERKHNERVRNKANAYIMEKRLKQAVAMCPQCGCLYTKASDGHVFKFCPDCGFQIVK